MDRETRIPEDVLTLPDDWEIDGEPLRFPVDDRDSLADALEAAAHVLRLVGGVITIAPVREKLAPGVYVTREYIVRWNSFVPAVEADEPAEEPAAVPE